MMKGLFLIALVALCAEALKQQARHSASDGYMSDGAEDEYSVRVEDDGPSDPHSFVSQVRPMDLRNGSPVRDGARTFSFFFPP